MVMSFTCLNRASHKSSVDQSIQASGLSEGHTSFQVEVFHALPYWCIRQIIWACEHIIQHVLSLIHFLLKSLKNLRRDYICGVRCIFVCIHKHASCQSICRIDPAFSSSNRTFDGVNRAYEQARVLFLNHKGR